MISPLMLQLAVGALVALSIGGVAVAALYPRLFAGSRGQQRLEAIGATKPGYAADRIAAEGGPSQAQRRRYAEELEETQKAKARKSQKPTLMDAHAPGWAQLEQAHLLSDLRRCRARDYGCPFYL